MQDKALNGRLYQEHEVFCTCGELMYLRYTKAYGGRVFYGCSTFPKCREVHSAHQSNGAPMGTPADKNTRLARSKAHQQFDRLWKNGPMTRKEAYAWLGEVMGLDSNTGHISSMDYNQCTKLIYEVQKHLGGWREKEDH